MKRKAMICIVALMIVFCGCAGEPMPINDGANQVDEVVTATDSDVISVTDSEITDNVENEVTQAAPVLQTAIADENNVNNFETVHHVGDYGYEQNLIWCERKIENVEIIPIETVDAETWYVNDAAVFSAGELLPGSAILLDLLVPEGYPSHGISYCADGVQYVYSIGYNGRDGGLSFVEIELTDKPKAESFSATVYSIEDTEGTLKLNGKETTVESSSAWHVWAQVKEQNSSYIPKTAYLNSFTVAGTQGRLDLGDGIYSANLGSEYGTKMLEAIANTYIVSYNLDSLYITVNGEAYSDGHIVLDEALALSE